MKTMKSFSTIAILCTVALGAQTKTEKDFVFKYQVCAKVATAYGSHVRFTEAEHIHVLLDERRARDKQAFPYQEWETASMSINWFGGPRPVSLNYIKSHMPRAMLFTLAFPADPNPHIAQADLNRLLEAEKRYNESMKDNDGAQSYIKGLLSKYGVGPEVIMDEDAGGVTPRDGCEQWEEKEMHAGGRP